MRSGVSDVFLQDSIPQHQHSTKHKRMLNKYPLNEKTILSFILQALVWEMSPVQTVSCTVLFCISIALSPSLWAP